MFMFTKFFVVLRAASQAAFHAHVYILPFRGENIYMGVNSLPGDESDWRPISDRPVRYPQTGNADRPSDSPGSPSRRLLGCGST